MHYTSFLLTHADTGIYVLMFESIFKRFLRVIVLTVLLVVMFALAFHMAFRQFSALFSRSPFVDPFHSLWKTMTMTVGEMDYEDIFQQSSAAADISQDFVPGLPFPEISYVLWVFFLILMPILFANLLVSPATSCHSVYSNCTMPMHAYMY